MLSTSLAIVTMTGFTGFTGFITGVNAQLGAIAGAASGASLPSSTPQVGTVAPGASTDPPSGFDMSLLDNLSDDERDQLM